MPGSRGSYKEQRQRRRGKDSWDGPKGLRRDKLNFPTPSVTSPRVESSTYVKPPQPHSQQSANELAWDAAAFLVVSGSGFVSIPLETVDPRVLMPCATGVQARSETGTRNCKGYFLGQSGFGVCMSWFGYFCVTPLEVFHSLTHYNHKQTVMQKIKNKSVECISIQPSLSCCP